MSFEHDNQLMLAGKCSRDFEAVGLNFWNAQPGQARHFSRMRSNDHGSSPAVELLSPSVESIQRVRIDNHIGDQRRVSSVDDFAHEFGGLGIARNAGAYCERLTFEQRIELWSERLH